MSGDEEFVDPEGLRTKAGEFDTEVVPRLTSANNHLNGHPKGVAYSAFSTLGFGLATAYLESLNFTFADIDTKTTTCMDFRLRLEGTADDWREAEEASTVQTEE